MKYGVYEFPLKRNSEFIPLNITGSSMIDALAVGGGTLVDGKYHTINYSKHSSFRVTYRVQDIKTWNVEQEYELDYGCMAKDLAYDEESKKVFGCFESYDTASGYELATINLETLDKDFVGALDRCYMALGINASGQMYGIGINGSLYTIDKTNGKQKLVGKTDVYPSQYIQSGCFDPIKIGRASCRERVLRLV